MMDVRTLTIIIASLATGTIKAFSSVFILASAMIGILLFQFAPKLAKLIFSKKKMGTKKAVAN